MRYSRRRRAIGSPAMKRRLFPKQRQSGPQQAAEAAHQPARY